MMGVWHSVNNCFLGSLNAAESCVRPRLWLLSWPFASSEAATGISCGSSLWGSCLVAAFGIQLQNCLANHRGMVSAMCRGCLWVSAMYVSRLPLGKCDACVEAADGKCDACVEAADGKCDSCVGIYTCVEGCCW